MMHYHRCCECESEWECYDVDCMGANQLLCDPCDEDEGLPVFTLTDLRR